MTLYANTEVGNRVRIHSGSVIGAGASGFQIAPTIADDVEQLTVFQRTAQWMFPNDKYHEQVPDGERWAMRHLPFYGRWFRFLTFYPGAGLTIERSRIDPNFDDSDGLAISETSQAQRADLVITQPLCGQSTRMLRSTASVHSGCAPKPICIGRGSCVVSSR